MTDNKQIRAEQIREALASENIEKIVQVCLNDHWEEEKREFDDIIIKDNLVAIPYGDGESIIFVNTLGVIVFYTNLVLDCDPEFINFLEHHLIPNYRIRYSYIFSLEKGNIQTINDFKELVRPIILDVAA